MLAEGGGFLAKRSELLLQGLLRSEQFNGHDASPE
jgi:hypothetical protein